NHSNDVFIEKLYFINADNIDIILYMLENVFSLIDRAGNGGCSIMRDDGRTVISIIHCRFKHLDRYITKCCAANASYQFFRFTGKHTATNYFYPAVLSHHLLLAQP